MEKIKPGRGSHCVCAKLPTLATVQLRAVEVTAENWRVPSANWGRRCSTGQTKVRRTCLCGELSDPRSRALAVVSPAGIAHMAGGRMGRKWQLEVQSRPQKAAGGLCSTSSPTFPLEVPPPSPLCHLGGSLSQPETSQPTTVAFA